MNTKPQIRIGDISTKHLYSVEVENKLHPWPHPQHVQILVDANTRHGAVSIATRYGYTVRSVNMIG